MRSRTKKTAASYDNLELLHWSFLTNLDEQEARDLASDIRESARRSARAAVLEALQEAAAAVMDLAPPNITSAEELAENHTCVKAAAAIEGIIGRLLKD